MVKSRHYGHLLIIAVYGPQHRLWVPMSLLYNSRYDGTSSGRFRYLELQSWTKVLRTVMQYSKNPTTKNLKIKNLLASNWSFIPPINKNLFSQRNLKQVLIF